MKLVIAAQTFDPYAEHEPNCVMWSPTPEFIQSCLVTFDAYEQLRSRVSEVLDIQLYIPLTEIIYFAHLSPDFAEAHGLNLNDREAMYIMDDEFEVPEDMMIDDDDDNTIIEIGVRGLVIHMLGINAENTHIITKQKLLDWYKQLE